MLRVHLNRTTELGETQRVLVCFPTKNVEAAHGFTAFHPKLRNLKNHLKL